MLKCSRPSIGILVYVQKTANGVILAGFTQASAVRPNAPLCKGLVLND